MKFEDVTPVYAELVKKEPVIKSDSENTEEFNDFMEDLRMEQQGGIV